MQALSLLSIVTLELPDILSLLFVVPLVHETDTIPLALTV